MVTLTSIILGPVCVLLHTIIIITATTQPTTGFVYSSYYSPQCLRSSACTLAAAAAAALAANNHEHHNNTTSNSSNNSTSDNHDLTNRFKYKVNALMGVFDPPVANREDDNERADTSSGHLLNALLVFPVQYTFHVVVRNDKSTRNKSKESHLEEDCELESVRTAIRVLVQDITGDTQLTLHETPRGKKFTKIRIDATVHNARMITRVYEQLEAMEQSIMQF